MDKDYIKIEIPEGKVIDIEQSSFQDGIIKFKNDDLYWEDVQEWMYKNVTGFAYDMIYSQKYRDEHDNRESLVSTRQQNHLIAYVRLQSIAYYLNGDWKPTSVMCYTIGGSPECSLDYNVISVYPNRPDGIYFKNEISAKRALKLMGDELKYMW